MASFDPATYITPPNFMGYSTNPVTTPVPITCGNNWPWTTSDTYAGCVYATDSATIATSCYQGSIVYSGITEACSAPAHSCEIIQIFETEGDSAAAWTMYNCVSEWYTLNLYRSLTGTSTSTFSPTSPATTDAGTITAASTTLTTATSSSSTTGDPVPSNNNSGSTSLSGGAIAGIAIGSVAGVLLLALLIFRRRILACCGYTRTPQSVYSPVYPLQQSPGQHNPGPQSASQPQSPSPWDKPEMAVNTTHTSHSTAPYRSTPQEME